MNPISTPPIQTGRTLRHVVIPTRIGKPKDKAKVEVRRPHRRTLDPGRPAKPNLLQPGRTQSSHRGKTPGVQSPQVPKAGQHPKRALSKTSTDPALKPLPETPYEYAEWKKATSQHRLPYRGRSPLLQRSLSAGQRTSGGPFHPHHRRSPYSKTDGSPATPAVTARAAIPPSQNICPKPISNTWNGPPPESSAGRPKPDPTPKN